MTLTECIQDARRATLLMLSSCNILRADLLKRSQEQRWQLMESQYDLKNIGHVLMSDVWMTPIINERV